MSVYDNPFLLIIAILLGMVVIGAWILMEIYSARNLAILLLLLRQGIKAEAKINGISEGRSGRNRPMFLVNYEFAVGTQIFRRHTTISRKVYKQLNSLNSNQITVRYLPHFPKISRTWGVHSSNSDNYLFALIFIVGGLMGIMGDSYTRTNEISNGAAGISMIAIWLAAFASTYIYYGEIILSYFDTTRKNL